VIDRSRLPPAARGAILAWYDGRGRTLPFRGTSDPYAILVSEAMAQQTQAARAGEAWLRFMEQFPTVAALAAATPAEVLRAWQGLGYNRRALNLWRAACQVVAEHGGRLPADLGSLEALSGVGSYTARAVAAIAFGLPVGAVDTNVRRVLGRIVAGDETAIRRSELQALADAAVPLDRPADWTHAIMDLGATVCRPRRPDCANCPARPWCRYAALAQATAHAPATAAGARAPAERAPAAGARGTATPFAATSRWLRGRIVDRLRAAPDGAWVTIGGPIGLHDQPAIERALQALATEGLVEIRGESLDDRQARLPVG
jgi:A/G-specific adenine glycosylase